MRPLGPISHAGSCLADGVLVGGAGVSESRARERVLALWTKGAVVRAVSGGRWLVVFPTPRRLDARDAPGALVIASHGVLATLPIDAATVSALDAAEGSLVHADHGELRVEMPAQNDVADWLSLDGIEVRESAPLGPEPSAARVALAPRMGVREAIDAKIPARAADAPTFESLASRGGGGALPLPPSAPSWLSSIVSWARGLFTGSGSTAGPSRSRRPPASTGGLAIAQPRPGLFASIRRWLDQWIFRSSLSRMLARQHAAYVQRMLELLERGDPREGLKWAIPLGDGASERSTTGTLAPRQSLAITLGAAAGSSLVGPASLYDLLRQRYLALLARLEAEGDIDSAAYVRAELLRDPGGAVALLERHQRFVKAAQLADAAKLDPTVRARSWMLAGDVARAIEIARRHGGMPQTIALLRRSHPHAADALALSWASTLAEAGSHAEAVDVARPVREGAQLVRHWVEIALEVGGVTTARMLAARATLSPEHWEDTRARALALLDDDGEEGREARAALSIALTQEPASLALVALARAALRTMTRDGTPSFDRTLPTRLESLANDGALRADRPKDAKPPARELLTARASPLTIHVEPRDVGGIAVTDSALLPSGRMVLALGEAGVRSVSDTGRTIAAFDTPADQLVLSDSGTRALAVVRRGEVCRVARIDLLTKRSEVWCEAKLAAFARTFDGTAWAVSDDGVPTLVDVLDTEWSALAKVDGVHCFEIERCRDSGDLALCTLGPESIQLWRYDATLGRLRARKDAALHGLAMLALKPSDLTIAFARDAENRYLVVLETESRVRVDGDRDPQALVTAGARVALAVEREGGVRVDLLDHQARPLLHVLLDGARSAGLRLTKSVLTIADDRGRVLAIDVETGTLLRNLRARA